MKINYISGNLLDEFESGRVDHIAHVSNCCGVFGSGIAHQIKERFPEAYNQYKQLEALAGLHLGTFSYSNENGKRIFNLNAQNLYGIGTRHLNYEAFYQCLEGMADFIEEGDSIGFPKYIGCYRAGGSWPIVEAMIIDVFKDLDVDVYIVEYAGSDK